MGSNKLVFCCIVGILAGFLVPVIFPWDRYVTLMIGLISGLAVGYLLDKRDENQGNEEAARSANKKAAQASRLLERARAGLDDPTLRGTDEEDFEDEEEEEDLAGEDPMEEIHDYEAEAREREQKLNDAEEMIRQARERMKK